MIKIKDIIGTLELMAPLSYAEHFDNVGLLVGNSEEDVYGVLVCHDALETVIDEAVSKKCNMIVCFHPILFTPIKKITGKNYVERALIKAIKNDIAIYAVHTALDNHQEGINNMLCRHLKIKDAKILIPKQNHLKKLVTYTLPTNVDAVRMALFRAGAGNIGHYSHCSFGSTGMGTYMGNENSNPVLGTPGALIYTEEVKIEVVFEHHLEHKILQALFKNHIYEEVAYEVYAMQNDYQNVGLGMVGMLEYPMDELHFLQGVKEVMKTGIIRHSRFLNKPIQKVAVLGGSGSFAIKNAIAAKADAFVTADLKYHQFYEAEDQLVLADIGHFESERYIKNDIVDFLIKKIPNFVVLLSEENTNPVKYF